MIKKKPCLGEYWYFRFLLVVFDVWSREHWALQQRSEMPAMRPLVRIFWGWRTVARSPVRIRSPQRQKCLALSFSVHTGNTVGINVLQAPYGMWRRRRGGNICSLQTEVCLRIQCLITQRSVQAFVAAGILTCTCRQGNIYIAETWTGCEALWKGREIRLSSWRRFWHEKGCLNEVHQGS